MIEEVIRFNASEAPVKMGTFSQYDHPHTLARYAEIADYLGLGGKSDEEKLENLIKTINDLKKPLGELHIKFILIVQNENNKK